MIPPGVRIAASGHRPDKIWPGYYLRGVEDKRALMNALALFAGRQLDALRPAEVISGMALGWDTAVALACVYLRIPFQAAVPFEGQEKLWTAHDQKLYRELLDHAQNVKVVCRHKLNIAYQQRNEYMVDHCGGVLALYNGTPGGTSNCIKYAESWAIPVDNAWEGWVRQQRVESDT